MPPDMREQLTEDDKWALIEEVGLLWDDNVAKEMAFELGLVAKPLGPDDPVPTRTIH